MCKWCLACHEVILRTHHPFHRSYQSLYSTITVMLFCYISFCLSLDMCGYYHVNIITPYLYYYFMISQLHFLKCFFKWIFFHWTYRSHGLFSYHGCHTSRGALARISAPQLVFLKMGQLNSPVLNSFTARFLKRMIYRVKQIVNVFIMDMGQAVWYIGLNKLLMYS